MNEIDKTNPFSQLGLSNTQESKSKDNDELGQAAFLELMTAQLKFQDPLKPMENGDFLAQMAQFGTVSGINELNSNFNTLSSSFQSNQALQASTLVGRRVLVPAEGGYLKDGASLSGSVDLEQPASKLIITVKSSSGQIVNRQDLGLQQAGLIDFEWNGLDQNGSRMPVGEYQIEAEVHRGTDVSSGATLSVVDVESVTLGKAGQDLTLSVSGLGDIDMSQVRKIL
ncbi:MAG: flagellar hook assembly protein FlgD [Gammaproteobacteria bacterium]|nr:flagellar hook assembly protein FlgD [Gammaproteobacteria bacterium]